MDHGDGDGCRHSGNQGTTGRPASAHYIIGEFSLRTRLGEALMPGEVSTGISLDRGSRQGLGEASPGLAKVSSLQASSVSLTARTWALRPLQSTGRASRSDASAVVAISVYKAVNKAAPSKGAAGVAISVLRRQPATTPHGRRHRGAHHEPLSRQPTVLAGRWPFPALVTPSPAMDQVHGLYLFVHPASFFVAMW